MAWGVRRLAVDVVTAWALASVLSAGLTRLEAVGRVPIAPAGHIAAPAATEAERMLVAVNDQRHQRGLRALTLDPRLSEAAAVQARYLGRTRKLDHRGQDGSRVGQRVDRAGYRWSTVAENLALAPGSSPRVVVDMWMHSRGHRENMLNREVTQMGVARTSDVWVLVLARPR